MTFPTIPTVAAGRVVTGIQASVFTSRNFTGALTSLTKVTDDLMIGIVITHGTSSGTNAMFSNWPTGWAELTDQGTLGNGTTTGTMGIGVAYKWVDGTGTETGNFTVTQAATPNGHAVLILLSIPGAHATTPPAFGTIATAAAGATADPGVLNPAGWDVEDTLWIAARGCGETGTGGTFTGLGNPPTNFTGGVQTGITSDVVGGIEGGVSFLQDAAASEDPDSGTSDTTNARNAIMILAVRPAPQNEFNLVVADAAQSQTVDNVTITQVHSLVVADAHQDQLTDNVAITQVHGLVVADAHQDQLADNVTLTVDPINLVVQDAHQDQLADNVTITVEGGVAPLPILLMPPMGW